MKPKTYRRDCVRCNKGFITVIEGMEYCNTDCAQLHEYDKRFPKKKQKATNKCLSCGMGVVGAKKYCDAVCNRTYVKAQGAVEKNKVANNAPKAEKKPSIPLYEINRRMEYKRLYEDHYIRRQIRGLTQDLI